MRKEPIIDHDPRELSRKALKFVAITTLALTVLAIIPLSIGVRWGVDQLPEWLIGPLAIAVACFLIGFFVGRRDAFREIFQTQSWFSRNRVFLPAYLRRVMHLLIRAPFAVVLLPMASWRKARDEGDGRIIRLTSFLTGLVLGLMVTLACLLLVVGSAQIILGY